MKKILELINRFKIIFAIISTVITLIAFRNIILLPIWYLIFPPTVKLGISELIIYRPIDNDLPTCEFDLIVNKLPEEDIGIALDDISLFRRGIIHKFLKSHEVFQIGPNKPIFKRLIFKDNILDSALKITPKASSMRIVLTYSYMNNNRIDSLVITDKDLVKCTYWLRPTFESKQEAFDFESDAFIATVFTDKGPFKYTTFVDSNFINDFDMQRFIIDAYQKHKINYDIYLPAFKRRYGGSYGGLLAQDTIKAYGFNSPYGAFCEINQYKLIDLFGMLIDEDFCKIQEFIHLSLDVDKNDEVYSIYQINKQYYIEISCERPNHISDYAHNLQALGYRVGLDSNGFYGEFQKSIGFLPPFNKYESLIRILNSKVDSINENAKNNGCLIFIPVILDSTSEKGIVRDIMQSTNKNYNFIFRYDCTPFRTQLLAASFATPIFVITDFVDSTRMAVIDSFTIDHTRITSKKDTIFIKRYR
jgi:hypothetical protein